MQLLLTLSALVAVASAGDVVTLTAKNFDTAIQGNPLMLVEFYAPWCVRCLEGHGSVVMCSRCARPRGIPHSLTLAIAPPPTYVSPRLPP
jgi:hypothetical protein